MESTKRVGAEIVNHGQIDRMTFPEGWVAGEPVPNPGIGSRSFRDVHRADQPEVSVCFFYRGLPVSDGAANYFHAVLQAAPHKLTEAELESVQEILRFKTPFKSEQFLMSSARTEDINGKRVLIVEGSYAASSDRIYEIYVDADGTGRVVQEIYYQAPENSYDRHAKDVMNIVQSIKWK